MYEFWVYEFDGPVSPLNTDYAVAWWAHDDPNDPTGMGDYNGDMVVDANDYLEWKAAFGDLVLPGTGADGNGDGIVDAADYTIWRNNLCTAGALVTPVPEPAWGLVVGLVAGPLGVATPGRN